MRDTDKYPVYLFQSFVRLSLSLSLYIYIYIYVCVCVCVFLSPSISIYLSIYLFQASYLTLYLPLPSYCYTDVVNICFAFFLSFIKIKTDPSPHEHCCVPLGNKNGGRKWKEICIKPVFDTDQRNIIREAVRGNAG